jgi:ABC-2 type transport system permease protein
MVYFIAFKNEINKFYIQSKRYIFDTLSRIISTYLIFLSLFYGIKFISGPDLDNAKLDAIIIGYIMWSFAYNAYYENSYDICEESTIGTLEQLFLAPIGFHSIVFFRMISGYLFSVLYNIAVLYLTMITTGRWLDLPIFNFLLITTLSIPAMYGLGYVFGGFSLVYKKIQSSLYVVQFALVFLVSLPAYPLNVFSFLPFTAGAYMINRMVVYGENFPLSWYLFIFAISLFYFFLGFGIFKLFEKKARRLNLLGQY